MLGEQQEVHVELLERRRGIRDLLASSALDSFKQGSQGGVWRFESAFLVAYGNGVGVGAERAAERPRRGQGEKTWGRAA